MGRPSLRRIRQKTFCSGDMVRANDGALLAELQGNAAKRENIVEFNTYHNMAFTVLPFSQEAFDVTEGVTNTGTGVIWLHRVPRASILEQVNIYNLQSQESINPGLRLKVSLIRSDDFPSVAKKDHADMGKVLEDITFSTFTATEALTIPVGFGVNSSPFTRLKANDFLFLYCTVELTADSSLIQFADIRQRLFLNVSLRLKEEHV